MKLSKDELLADIEQQGSTKKCPPKVAPLTRRGYKSILSLWQEYDSVPSCKCDESLTKSKRFALRIDQPALVPSAGCMKSFFKMLAIEHEGMLGLRLSLNTLCLYVTRLATAYKHEHDIEISQRVVKEVKDVRRCLSMFFYSIKEANTRIVDSNRPEKLARA